MRLCAAQLMLAHIFSGPRDSFRNEVAPEGRVQSFDGPELWIISRNITAKAFELRPPNELFKFPNI